MHSGISAFTPPKVRGIITVRTEISSPSILLLCLGLQGIYSLRHHCKSIDTPSVEEKRAKATQRIAMTSHTTYA